MGGGPAQALRPATDSLFSRRDMYSRPRRTGARAIAGRGSAVKGSVAPMSASMTLGPRVVDGRVHGSRSEQPIQESLLKPVLHAVRTT